MANGELGLTVTAGGEFSPDNKFYSPQKLAALVMQLSAKLSVLGQTKVLFSGPGMLLTALEHMSEIAAIEAKRSVGRLWRTVGERLDCPLDSRPTRSW